MASLLCDNLTVLSIKARITIEKEIAKKILERQTLSNRDFRKQVTTQ